jgi:hypothetical protein
MSLPKHASREPTGTYPQGCSLAAEVGEASPSWTWDTRFGFLGFVYFVHSFPLSLLNRRATYNFSKFLQDVARPGFYAGTR